MTSPLGINTHQEVVVDGERFGEARAWRGEGLAPIREMVRRLGTAYKGVRRAHGGIQTFEPQSSLVAHFDDRSIDTML
jgi:hypothetical protein